MFEGVTLGGRYQVYGKIGGSSLVVRYDGIDTLLARPVDIVALAPEAASDPDVRDQFQALGRAAATRSQPHIIDVYDIDVFDEQPFVVTEHMAGETLRSIIDTEAPFHPDDVVALIQQLAPAADNELTRAAGGAMVSADTVFVDAAGTARHSDFLTFGDRFAAVVDQWSASHQASPAPTPVQAIAAIAYQLLTAQSPEPGPSRVMPPSVVNAAVTPDIDRIILRGLDRRLRDYPSAVTFTAALTAAVRRARQVRELATPPPTRTLPDPSTLVARAAPVASMPPPAARPDSMVDDDVFDPLLVDAMEGNASHGRFHWAAVAIVVLALLVVALALARFNDWLGSNGPSNASSGVSGNTTMPAVTGTSVAANQVPSITGLTRDAAASTLSQRGLILHEDAPIYSDTITSGAVAEQRPSAGASIPGNRTISVKLSRGPSSVDLATLSLPGMAEADARQELERRGFVVQAREAASDTVPAGRVISLEPNGVVKTGAPVTLAVSVGNKVQIPREIFSMPLKDAETRLAQAGITVAGTITVGPAAIQGRLDTTQYKIASGDVIGVQDQPGDAAFGAWIPRDSPVTLVYFDASS